MSALDIVAKAAAKGAKKAAPFYSKADLVLQELQRGKGSGNEFLGEMIKKGVKPTELRERGIEQALKDKPKMTKAEVQKVFEEKSAPKVGEQVRGGSNYEEALDIKAQEILDDPDASFYELSFQDKKLAEDEVKRDFGYNPETKHEEYSTPGGENYREILLKLPQRGLTDAEQSRMMSYEANMRRGQELDPWMQGEYNKLKQKEAQGGQDYRTKHFSDTPNILAHIRVQDFKTPEGKKVLLVDEIQSDWHQAARDLRKKEVQRIMDETGVDKKTASAQVPDDFGYKTQEKPREAKTAIDKDGYWEVRDQNGEFITNIMGYQYPDADQAKILEVANSRISANNPTQIRQSEQVPDAPFKKNWHELAMKRVLDYAAENGYDTVAITPGVEHVKRYEDATRKAVDEVAMYGDTLVGFKDGRKVIEQPIGSPDELQKYVGKDIAQKLSTAAPDMNSIRSVKGEDLTVGGEGMKGFYDKILPDYLNNYGKKYGAQVGDIQLETGKEMSRGPTGTDMIPSYAPTTQSFHAIDITPQMREEIKTKGQPLYGKVSMPVLEGLAAGSGAATIGPQVFGQDNEQDVQNPIHFSENPDAMRLELMQSNQIE